MKTNTKDIFIDTASSLFANQGYHATGISEILKKSNAPKGSLYYYFPQGKEQLAQEALQKTAEKISTEILDVLAKASTPLEGLQQHLIYIAQKIEKDLFQPNVSINLIALETFSSNEIIRLECERTFQQIQNIYKNSFLKMDLQEEYADFLAMTMVMLTEGAITLSLTKKNTQPLHQLANNLPLLINFNNLLGENYAK
ncbi:TetR/AcrR family transcriptional regulator [Megamonas funiformis]|uniref:TetR/AcrR family transcriptional regulator n=1 Tax=Megamonas funiformis TaxID=437897 RepID=UPI002674097E|nr:TetR/AcrR family transcriptional regulator [Megamonas funiformis]